MIKLSVDATKNGKDLLIAMVHGLGVGLASFYIGLPFKKFLLVLGTNVLVSIGGFLQMKFTPKAQ